MQLPLPSRWNCHCLAQPIKIKTCGNKIMTPPLFSFFSFFFCSRSSFLFPSQPRSSRSDLLCLLQTDPVPENLNRRQSDPKVTMRGPVGRGRKKGEKRTGDEQKGKERRWEERKGKERRLDEMIGKEIICDEMMKKEELRWKGNKIKWDGMRLEKRTRSWADEIRGKERKESERKERKLKERKGRMRWKEMRWEMRKGKKLEGKEIKWDEVRWDERKGKGKDRNGKERRREEREWKDGLCRQRRAPRGPRRLPALASAPSVTQVCSEVADKSPSSRGPAAASQHRAHDVSRVETLLRTHRRSCSPLRDKIQRGWSFTSYRFPPASLAPPRPHPHPPV